MDFERFRREIFLHNKIFDRIFQTESSQLDAFVPKPLGEIWILCGSRRVGLFAVDEISSSHCRKLRIDRKLDGCLCALFRGFEHVTSDRGQK